MKNAKDEMKEGSVNFPAAKSLLELIKKFNPLKQVFQVDKEAIGSL